MPLFITHVRAVGSDARAGSTSPIAEPLGELAPAAIEPEMATPLFDFAPPAEVLAPVFPVVSEELETSEPALASAAEPAMIESDPEPIPQGQPIPYQLGRA